MTIEIRPLCLFIFLALFVLISACVPVATQPSPGPLFATPTGLPVEEPAITEAEPTPTATAPPATATAPPSPTETALSMPPTPTPLPVALPAYPSLSYLPPDLPVISPANAAGLYQVAWLAEDRLTGLAWSPDGDWLGAISQHGVAVYQAAALPLACYGENCDVTLPAGRYVETGDLEWSSVYLSPAGEMLAVLHPEEFAVDLYDVASGQFTRRLEWLEHASPVLYGVAFSPDWNTLAWYTRGTLLLMDVATGQQGPMLSTEDFIQAIAFSPDGSLIAASAGGTVDDQFQPLVQVWQVADGAPLVTLTYAQVAFSSVATLLRFSADGSYLMAGHNDGSIAVWSLPGGEPRMFIGGSNLPVTELAMSADGNSLLAAYAGQTAMNWDLTKSREPLTWNGTLAAISPDAGMVALLTSDGREELINASTGEQIAGLGIHPYLSSLSLSPDSHYLAALSVEQSSLWTWQVPDLVEMAPLSIPPDKAFDLAFAPDGATIAAAWYGCQARIWDAPSGEILRMIASPAIECAAEPVMALSPDPEDPLLAMASAAGNDGWVNLWDYQTGQEITRLSLGQGSVNSLVFSPAADRLAAGTGQTGPSGEMTGGHAVVWNLSDGSIVHTLPHDNWVTGLAISPDGRILAAGTAAQDAGGAVSGSLINLWDVESGQLLRSLESFGDHVVSLAFSPDGEILAAGDWSGNLNVWETNSGEKLASLGANNTPIADLDFSPDGRLLAAAILTGGASTIEIWDVASEVLLTRLEGERLDFASDGAALASIVFGSIRLWGVAP